MLNIKFWKKQKINNENFVSCEALNSHITFFGRKVAFCSMGNPAQNRVFPCIYDNIDLTDFENKFNVKELIKHIQTNRKNLEKGIIPKNCEGCNNLDKKYYRSDITKLKNFMEYVQFSEGGICNSRCIYCDSWKNTMQLSTGEYTTKSQGRDTYPFVPIIKQLIKNNIITKETIIDFAGGEPTLHKEFEDALSFFLNFGIKKVFVFSNVINYSDIIAEGIKKGVVILTVSIDAGSKEIHKKVKGVESYDFVWENLIKYLQVQKFPEQIVSKYVIVPNINDTVEEISIWIEKSKQIGINKLILNLDNRVFENNIISQDLILKIKNLTEFFINKTQESKINSELYSNILGIYEDKISSNENG